MNIKTKILILTSSLLVSSIGFSLFFSLRSLKASSDLQVAKSMEQAQSLTFMVFENIQQKMKNEASLIAEVPLLSLVTEEGDPKTIQDAANSYREQLRLDFIDVFNEDGDLLARTSSDGNFATEKTSSPQYQSAVKEALQGRKFATLISLENKLMMIGASPIGLDADPTGILVVGTFLNESFLSELKRLTQTEVSLENIEHKILASSRPTSDSSAAPQIQLSKPLHDEHNNAIGAVTIGALRNDSEKHSQDLLQTVTMLGLVLFLVTTACSGIMGKFFVRPE